MWNWERVLTETKAFFQSGFFYIALGCLFLVAGYRLTSAVQTHSAFIFLLVILGVALVLYGTGTSATGEGTKGSIKVAIAGGAGVLALVLGFGVVFERDGLTDVFKSERDYGLLDITLPKNVGIPVDLSRLDVDARLGGRVPLPVLNDNQKIEILVPIPQRIAKEASVIVVRFIPKPGFQANYVNDTQQFKVLWASNDVQETDGFANEKIRVMEVPLEPLKHKELQVPSGGQVSTKAPSENLPISPE
jgi:hypothetical protein